MRSITKGSEPNSPTQYRLRGDASYDGYPDKDTLRTFLVAEQRGLCCYCMSRIRAEWGAVKIAHWHAQHPQTQTEFPGEELLYSNLLAACKGNEGNVNPVASSDSSNSNLLAACKGNEGRRGSRQHCDTAQRNLNISRNPANPAHRVSEVVRFSGDGTIYSDDPDFNGELNCVLNLNLDFLKTNRRATLEAFTMLLKKRGRLPPHTLNKLLREWDGETHSGELAPYCQVVVYWLKKRLARRS